MKKEREFPHWKVQYYDTLTLCWRGIPKAYTSLNEAELTAKRLPVQKVRLLQVEKNGRIIMPEMKK